MLRRWNSPTRFVGDLVEHQCPRCQRAVELPMGELCDACRWEINRRAVRLANWISLGTTVLIAVYVCWRMPADPTARLVGGMSIGIWFLLSNLVVRRAARELMR